MRWMLCLMLLPVLLPALHRPLSRRLAGGATWARCAVFAAPLVTLWLMSIYQNLYWAIVPCGIVVAVSVVFCTRDLQFTRRDFVLVPVFLTAWLAAIDIAPQYAAHQHVLVVSILILVLRIAVTFVPSRLPPAFAFVAAPLGLILQTGFFGRDQRYLGWHALAIVAITPFVLRVFLREERLALRSSRK
jgi:hypothetical protein